MTRYQEIPWLRIGTESVAIVASILLAFAIDAWWVDGQERDEEQRLLVALRAEVQNNILELDAQLAYRNAVAESASILLDAAAGNVKLEPRDLDRHLGSLTWWGEADWSTGVVTSLIQGGKLSVIESESLLILIASLPDEFDQVQRIELQDYQTFRNVLMPYLYENALVPQLSNAQPDQPGTGDFSQPRLPIGGQRDHSHLIEDEQFIGILAHKHWDQADTITVYSELREELEKLILEIDKVLGE